MGRCGHVVFCGVLVVLVGQSGAVMMSCHGVHEHHCDESTST